MMTIIVEADNSDSRSRLPVYLRTYIAALLDHDEVSEAKTWTAKLKSVRTKGPGHGVVGGENIGAPEIEKPGTGRRLLIRTTCRMLCRFSRTRWKTGKSMRCRRRMPTKPTTSMPKGTRMRRKRWSWRCSTIFSNRSPSPVRRQMPKCSEQRSINTMQRLSRTIPDATLTQVPYLVRQGRRNEAVELTTKKENWEPAQFWTLFSACEAVLTDLEKHVIAPDAGDAGTPVSNGEETAKLTEEVRSQSAAIEGDAAERIGRSTVASWTRHRRKTRKTSSTAVAFILSLLANHDFNTGHADPQRYQRAAALYTEILTLQPENVEAIQQRAMILEASGESLGTSLVQINRAWLRTARSPWSSMRRP